MWKAEFCTNFFIIIIQNKLACQTLQQQTFLRKTADTFFEKVSLLGQVKHRQKWKIISVTPVLVSQQWLVTLRTRWLPTSGQCCLWDDWWPPLVSWGQDSSSSSLVLSTTCPWLSCEFSCPFFSAINSSPLAVLWVSVSVFSAVSNMLLAVLWVFMSFFSAINNLPLAVLWVFMSFFSTVNSLS